MKTKILIIAISIVIAISNTKCSKENIQDEEGYKTSLQDNVANLDTEFHKAEKENKIDILKQIKKAKEYKYIFIVIRAAFDEEEDVQKQALITFEHFRQFAIDNAAISFYEHINNWVEENPMLILKQMRLEKEYSEFIRDKEEKGYRTAFYKQYPLKFLTDTKTFSIISNNIINQKINTLTQFWTLWLIGKEKLKNKIPLLISIIKENKTKHNEVIKTIALYSLSQFNYEYFEGLILEHIKSKNPYMQEIASIYFGKNQKEEIIPIITNIIKNPSASEQIKLGIIWTIIKMDKEKELLKWALYPSYKNDYIFIKAYKLIVIHKLNLETIPNIVIEAIYHKNSAIRKLAFKIIQKENTNKYAKLIYPILKEKTPSEIQLDTLILLAEWKDQNAIPHIKKLINTLSQSLTTENEDNKNENSKDEKDNEENKNKESEEEINENEINENEIEEGEKEEERIKQEEEKEEEEEEESKSEEEIQKLKYNIINQAIESITEIGYYNNILVDVLEDENLKNKQRNLSINAMLKTKYQDNKEKENVYRILKDYYLENSKENENKPLFREIIKWFGDKKEIDLMIQNGLETPIGTEAIYAIPHFKTKYENFDFLFDTMKKTKTEEIHTAIVEIFGILQYENAFKLLVKITKSKLATSSLKAKAIIALGKLQNTEGMHLLIIYLYNSDANIKLAAIKALGLLNDKRAIPHLEKRYEQLKDNQGKIYVILSLALIQDLKERFMKNLIKMARDTKDNNKNFVKDFLDELEHTNKKEKLINYLESYKKLKKEEKEIITDFLTPKEEKEEEKEKEINRYS